MYRCTKSCVQYVKIRRIRLRIGLGPVVVQQGFSCLDFVSQNLSDDLGSKWITSLADQISLQLVQSPSSVDFHFLLKQLIESSLLKTPVNNDLTTY